MSDAFQLALWFLGAPIALAVLALAGAGVEWTLVRMEGALGDVSSRRDAVRARSAERSSRRRDHAVFLQWLANQTGTSAPDGSVDEELIAAHRQGELLRFLVEEEIPKSVMQCLEIHRLMASVTGARHYSEVAYEPECYRLRANVAWLLGHTVTFLETYPLRFADARLIHNSIVIRKRAYPTCRRCPYIDLAVLDAPVLCPTAELVQVRSECNESNK